MSSTTPSDSHPDSHTSDSSSDSTSDKADNPSHQPKKAPIRHLKILFQFMAPYKLMVSGALIALLFAAGATLAIFKSFELIVDQGFAAEDASTIDQYFLGLLVVVGVLAVATFVRFTLVSLLGERVVTDIRKSVFNRLISLHPSYFESNRPGEITSRLTADTTIIQSVIGSSLSIALRSTITTIGAIIMMYVISPKMLMMMSMGIPFVVLPMVYFGGKVRKLSAKTQDKVAGVGTMAGEVLSALPIVQAFTQEKHERSKFDDTAEAAYLISRKRIISRGFMTMFVIAGIFSAIDMMLWSGANDVIGGSMTGGQLASFVGLAILMSGNVGALGEVYGELQRASGAAIRLAELMSEESVLAIPLNPKTPSGTIKGEVAFNDVDFYYPSRPDDRAMHGFTLKVNPGETIALVGPSGAGKSTVMQLLLRFFDPQKGSVEIEGIDVRDMAFETYRDAMAIVMQDTVVFADTVLENVRYGRAGASDAEVMEAIKAAQAEKFVSELPKGENTYLGERGVRLSGGQRQRLAIARAILRDAPILLLDEATSALDSESEVKVQKALEACMEGRTTIVIAHRLSTVRKADRIVVLDEGRVIDEGNHEELMKKGGLYARLADLQFQNGEG